MFKYLAFGGLLLAIAYTFFYKAPISLKHHPLKLRPNYDYIIVGGGSAGCTLAARLSEDPDITVLLLEAGDTPPYHAQIPALFGYLQRTHIDWNLKTVPQKSSGGAYEKQEILLPRGKVLGGSSTINYMQYTRGHPEDYNHWARLLDDQSWSYSNVLPYFLKSEDIRVDSLKNSKYHGKGGPIPVGPGARTILGETFLRAAKESGFAVRDDYNDLNDDGFTYAQQTAMDGKRWSTYEAFLIPAMNRQNLDVLPGAHVLKVEFDGLKAQGVRYLWETEERSIKANKEIILSASTFGTPQLLLLSGIGPAEHLKQFKIPLVRDLPSVGQHMCDHVASDVVYSFNQSVAFDLDELSTMMGFVKAASEYFLFGSGPWSYPPIQVTGFGHSSLVNDTRPSYEFVVLNGPLVGEDMKHTFDIKPEVYKTVYGDAGTRHTISFLLFTSRLHSEGEVKLRSDNPLSPPYVDLRMLENELDVRILLEGRRILQKIAESDAFKKFDIKIHERPLEECKHAKFMSDEYLMCSIRLRAWPSFHHACSCRMGKDDQSSVVDSKFKVHGISNLRIVDASTFPDHVSGNTNAPVIMMAEKAADLILGKKL